MYFTDPVAVTINAHVVFVTVLDLVNDKVILPSPPNFFISRYQRVRVDKNRRGSASAVSRQSHQRASGNATPTSPRFPKRKSSMKSFWLRRSCNDSFQWCKKRRQSVEIPRVQEVFHRMWSTSFLSPESVWWSWSEDNNAKKGQSSCKNVVHVPKFNDNVVTVPKIIQGKAAT